MATDLKAIVLCDFDGTTALKDVYDGILAAFGGDTWRSTDADFEAGKITFEDMNRDFAKNLTCSPSALDRFIRDSADIREGFHAFHSFAKAQNIGFILLSSGWDLYIRTILDNQPLSFIDNLDGIEASLSDRENLAVVCNRTAHNGSFYEFTAHPLKTDRCAPNKRLIAAHLKSKFCIPVIAIGDGISDYEMAEEADFVFATGKLAEYCTNKNIRFSSFTTFKEIEGKIIEAANAQNMPSATHDTLKGRLKP